MAHEDRNNLNNLYSLDIQRSSLVKSQGTSRLMKVTVVPVVTGPLRAVSKESRHAHRNRSEHKVGGNPEKSFVRNNTSHKESVITVRTQ